jgi:hypothetical protein
MNRVLGPSTPMPNESSDRHDCLCSDGETATLFRTNNDAAGSKGRICRQRCPDSDRHRQYGQSRVTVPCNLDTNTYLLNLVRDSSGQPFAYVLGGLVLEALGESDRHYHPWVCGDV